MEEASAGISCRTTTIKENSMKDFDQSRTACRHLAARALAKDLSGPVTVAAGQDGYDEAQAAGTTVLEHLDEIVVMLERTPSTFTYNDETLGEFGSSTFDHLVHEMENAALSPHAAQALAIAQGKGRDDDATRLLERCIASMEVSSTIGRQETQRERRECTSSFGAAF